MTKRLSIFLILFSLIVSLAVPCITAEEKDDPTFYVSQGAISGIGTQDSPFGSIEEALKVIGGLDAEIVINGEYDISQSDLSAWNGLITLSGVGDAVITSDPGVKLSIPGKISFKNIKFDLGENSAFLCNGKSISFDIGNNSFDGAIYLSSSNFANYAICSDITVISGNIDKVILGNSQSELEKYTASGTVDINVKGGRIKELYLSPEIVPAKKYTISGGINVICSAGGKIDNISYNKDSLYTIKGGFTLIFNEGVGLPEKFEYPDSYEDTYILTTGKGGSLLPTNDIGIFEIKTDSSKALALNGKAMNVKDTLAIDSGSYNFEWVDKTSKDSDDDYIPAINDIPVTVYYNPNGGLNPPAAKEALKGSSITISSKIPTNDGYRFLGWSLDKDAKEAAYQAGDKFVCKDNVSLYAVWEKITEFTLTYSAQGAYYVPEKVSVTVGEEVKLSTIIPSKKGYVFLGWALKNDAETPKFTAGEKITLQNDTTLYAVWKQGVEIVLTINSNIAKVSGVSIENDVAPIIENDRTMLPARFVAENLDAEVKWDDSNRTVIIKTEDTEILIPIDSDTAKINGKEVKLDSPAFIRNDRTYTPVRFICEALGAEVGWNDAERKVTITK
ncbi:MAG: hypothetical protein E7621_03795 [Ruminococcaceae bacterium]|nr:hypothetical protein [Oscillospiraceae bacterium]